VLNIHAGGVPLGLLETRDYEDVSVQTAAGDMIVLYSDGITDHMGTGGREYGKGRLAHLVRTNSSRGAEDLITAIFADLDKVSTKPFDDQTLFVMKVK